MFLCVEKFPFFKQPLTRVSRREFNSMTEIVQKVEGIDQSELIKVLNLVGLPKIKSCRLRGVRILQMARVKNNVAKR